MVMKFWNWCMKSYICCHIVKMINSAFHNSDDAHENLYDGDEYCAKNPV